MQQPRQRGGAVRIVPRGGAHASGAVVSVFHVTSFSLYGVFDFAPSAATPWNRPQTRLFKFGFVSELFDVDNVLIGGVGYRCQWGTRVGVR